MFICFILKQQSVLANYLYRNNIINPIYTLLKLGHYYFTYIVQEVCHCFWPNSKGVSSDYGKLTVTLKDQKIFSDFVLRKFEIVEDHRRNSFTSKGTSITQFHYLKWQEKVPHSTSAILEIVSLVQKVQMSTGNKPIVVVCK